MRRFPSLSSAEVAFEPLPEPPVSAVGLAEHQRIYAVFEALKSAPYSQIHFADLGGLGHYLTLGKKSGLFFANTQLVVHVLGSSLFCRDAQEALVNSEALLMTDVFECTSVENFDHVLVHDRKAWTWYGNRLSSLPKAVDDISWGAADRVKQALATAPSVRNSPQKGLRIVYLGTLGPEAGLRFFCDSVSHLIKDGHAPIEISFVGEPGSVGAVDAVTYVRIRAQDWRVPVAIERNLGLIESIEYVTKKPCVVVCNATRKQGLSARLFDSLGIPYVLVSDERGSPNAVAARTPDQLATRIMHFAMSSPAKPAGDMVAAWRSGRSWNLAARPAVPVLPGKNDTPLVSVVVAHYSRPQKLRSALRSLKNQSYREL